VRLAHDLSLYASLTVPPRCRPIRRSWAGLGTMVAGGAWEAASYQPSSRSLHRQPGLSRKIGVRVLQVLGWGMAWSEDGVRFPAVPTGTVAYSERRPAPRPAGFGVLTVRRTNDSGRDAFPVVSQLAPLPPGRQHPARFANARS